MEEEISDSNSSNSSLQTRPIAMLLDWAFQLEEPRFMGTIFPMITHASAAVRSSTVFPDAVSENTNDK